MHNYYYIYITFYPNSNHLSRWANMRNDARLYNLRKFATDTEILQMLLPDIAPDAYFDDQSANTLNALYDHDIGNLERVDAGAD